MLLGLGKRILLFSIHVVDRFVCLPKQDGGKIQRPGSIVDACQVIWTK
jgi:hypothetical protein